jgi:sec-independent protein translocase protein TatB
VFGISGTELVLIAVFALIIFGPDKIPEIARTVNKAVNTFKKVQEDTEKLIKAEMLGADGKSASSGSSAAVAAVPEPTVASTLYGGNDDDDEEEEE